MVRLKTVALALIALVSFSPRAHSQWQGGNLALRTNGNMFQSGDQLKVELLALEAVNEPFSAQVSHQFEETVIQKDKDGGESPKQVLRTRTRKMSPIFESLGQFKSVVLGDTFHFGEGNPTGRYLIEVTIFTSDGRERASVLRSCVFFHDRDQYVDSCQTYIRSLKRANDERWLTFDGHFTDRSRYTAALLDGDKVVHYIEIGVYSTGAHELNISSDLLRGTAGKTLDILVHDHLNNYTTTLGRVTIPSAQ